MRVIIDLEIETPDYEGVKFMVEINKLLSDIRKDMGDNEKNLRLVKFKMRDKYGDLSDSRDFEWTE